MRKSNKKEFNEKLKNKGKTIKIIGEYVDCKTDTNLLCLVCGYGENFEWKRKPDGATGCPICKANKNRLKLDDVILRLYKIDPQLKLISEYKRADKKILLYHNGCGHTWECTLNQLTSYETSCPHCYNIKKQKSHEDAINQLNKLDVPIIMISTYIKDRIKCLFKCLMCGYIWSARLSKILIGNRCPSCSKSGFKPNKPGFLYYIKIIHNNYEYYKIGISNVGVKKRFKKQDLLKITIIFEKHYDKCIYAYDKEQEILKEFNDYRYIGDPILQSGGNTEIFIKDIFCDTTIF